ncbi:MAG: hypothetical protein Q9221_002083 [Calogaya cf. arnoldii]
MFAIYLDSIATPHDSTEQSIDHLRLLPPIGRGSASPSGGLTMTHPANLDDSETHPSVEANGPRLEVVTQEELEAIKATATDQTKLISSKSLGILAGRGLTLKDFAVWNWILSGKTAMEAMLRLELVNKPSCEASADLGPVPSFIFSRLLLRNDISAEALSIFIPQVHQLLTGQFQQYSHSRNAEQNEVQIIVPIGLDALTTMIVRLLRHIRKVWPAVIINVAELWVTHARNDGTNDSRLSFHYNRILQLIGLPSKESPYKSLPHREHAQHILLRKMLDSGLVVNREGYRAFALTQLAHRKTESEREWARLKGPTWPPWKADRTGMDADIGPESGVNPVNRGPEISAIDIRYCNSVATIVNRGPEISVIDITCCNSVATIVNRGPEISVIHITCCNSVATNCLSLLLLPQAYIRKTRKRKTFNRKRLTYALYQESKRPRPEPIEIWTARVKATRTLHEAWECFLACKSQGALRVMPSKYKNEPLVRPLYQAMMEKIIYDGKRGSAGFESKPEQIALPGDGMEVAEPDTSHNQVINSREPMPTVNSLLEHMISHGIHPYGRSLALLLNHAGSYEEGFKALEMSSMKEPVRSILLIPPEQPWDEAAISHARSLLETLPEWIFAAYINFLCRFAHFAAITAANPSACILERQKLASVRMKHAFRLVRTLLPTYRPPWNSLLWLLARRACMVVEKNKKTRSGLLPSEVKFQRAGRLLECMDALTLGMDFTGFMHLCEIVNNTNTDCGLEVVKVRFARLVRPLFAVRGGRDAVVRLSDYCCDDRRGIDSDSRPNDGSAPLPRLLRIPHPANLHAYIRCLGYYHDRDGLVEFMSWLASFADEIILEAKESANGRTMFRTCLTALRVFGHIRLIRSTEDREQEQRYNPSILRVRWLTTAPIPQDQNTSNKNPESASTSAPSLLQVYSMPARHTGHIRVMTLNSPRNKNAISRQLLAELESELRSIHHETTKEDLAWQNKKPGAALGQGTRAIVIDSAVDDVFCAGADLKERKTMTKEETNEFLTRLRRTFAMIHDSAIPSISAISSIAFGGGLELGLATHFRVFGPSTTVALPETRLGIVPGAGGTYRLRDLLGETRALDLVLTGRKVGAQEALRIGLCDRVVGPTMKTMQTEKMPDKDVRQFVLQCAIDMAGEICEGGPATTRPVMNMVRGGGERTEAEEYENVLATEDRNEALRAFTEKRKAVFKGN